MYYTYMYTHRASYVHTRSCIGLRQYEPQNIDIYVHSKHSHFIKIHVLTQERQWLPLKCERLQSTHFVLEKSYYCTFTTYRNTHRNELNTSPSGSVPEGPHPVVLTGMTV